MQLFSELLQCPENQFKQRVSMLERLHNTWKFDHLVPMTRSSSEADSDDVAFARDPPHSLSGYYIRFIRLAFLAERCNCVETFSYCYKMLSVCRLQPSCVVTKLLELGSRSFHCKVTHGLSICAKVDSLCK